MSTLAPGQRFDRYEIEQLLGRGGMGQVYRAFDTRLRRRVALKILRPDRPVGSGETASSSAAPLLREARAAAALKHPNLVAIFDASEAEGTPFIVMELVEGKSLRSLVGDAALPLCEKVRWLLDVAGALGAAHERGLVHRDVKPENVVVCADGTAKLLDFGIAKSTHAEGAPPSEGAAPAPSAEGRVAGTPRYMAPEQLRGEPVDGRADQYSWGLTAYELLAGMHPLSALSTEPSATALPLEPNRLLSEVTPEVPFELAAVVMRTLASRPGLRFASMEDVARALAPFAVEPAASVGRVLREPAVERADVRVAEVDTVLPTLTSRRKDDEHERATALDARFLDPNGTPRAHLLVPGGPFLAFLIAVGFTVALWHTPRAVLVLPFDVLALVAIYLAPLAGFARAARYARVKVEPGLLRVERAGLWAQTVPRKELAAASMAYGPQGTSVMMARRGRHAPLRLELGEPGYADAVRDALELPDNVYGALRWPTGRGALDWLGVVLALAWRAALFAAVLCLPLQKQLAGTVLGLCAIALGLLSGLVWLVSPGPGPSLTLSAGEVRISRRRRQRSLPCVEIERARATEDGIAIHLAGGEVVFVPAKAAAFSRRGLSPEDCIHVAAHIDAAAKVARRG